MTYFLIYPFTHYRCSKLIAGMNARGYARLEFNFFTTVHLTAVHMIILILVALHENNKKYTLTFELLFSFLAFRDVDICLIKTNSYYIAKSRL